MFDKIINLENLFLAWKEFRKGKSAKPDVLLFEKNLEQNIFELHNALKDGTYEHAPYQGFFITDPKLRHVHKAEVRDRVLHHSIFNILNPKFEPGFISTSFSCQVGKGSHRGVRMISKILRKVSRNNTIPCYALKCDVQKFFDSVDHQILLTILKKKITDQKTIDLLTELVASFEKSGIRERERERERERFVAV
jgi:RNA-directed DNA polymerase